MVKYGRHGAFAWTRKNIYFNWRMAAEFPKTLSYEEAPKMLLGVSFSVVLVSVASSMNSLVW